MSNIHNSIHPGEFIKEVYLDELGISINHAAKKLDVYPSTLARLVSGKASVSPEMALKLSKAFGRTPESWLQMQANHDNQTMEKSYEKANDETDDFWDMTTMDGLEDEKW